MITLCSMVTCSLAFADVDVEPITYNTDVWKIKPSKLSEDFPLLSWKKHDSYIASTAKNLKLWNENVEAVSLHQNESGSTGTINFTILSQSTLAGSKPESFILATSEWKSVLDKKLGAVGIRRPTEDLNGSKIARIEWETDHATVALLAKSSKFPESLNIAVFQPNTELQNLAIVESATEQSAVITEELKGLTSFYTGGKYKKKDISKSPEYYLLYFAASW